MGYLGFEVLGGCLCGAVRYEIRGELRPVVNCHCSLCRRFHGHFGAYTSAPRETIAVHNPQGHLKWYRSPGNGARRGFCANCGSSLFWDRDNAPTLSITAGTLDQPSRLRTVAHIFTEDKADYYELGDTLEDS